MRKLLYIFIGLSVLILAGLLIGPSFFDWNTYKPQIAAAVKDALGRELRIDGNLDFMILPSPALSVSRVSLENVQGANNRKMVAFDKVEVKVDINALLQGRIAVTSVRLVRPIIALEITKEGKASWDIKRTGIPSLEAKIEPPNIPSSEPKSTPSAKAVEPSSGLAVDVSLDSLLIEDAVVTYTDARSGLTERIENLNTEISAESLKGPFRAEGQLTTHGIPLGFGLTVGRISPDRPLPIKFRIAYDEASSDIRFTGQLNELTPHAVLSGKVKFSVPDVAALARGMGVADLPLPATQSLSLSADASASATNIDINKLSMQFGDMSFAGAIHGQLNPIKSLDIVLSSSRIDLDQLLATPTNTLKPSIGSKGQTNATEARVTPSTKSSTGGGGGLFVLPSNIAVKFDLGVETASYRGGVIRNTVFRGDLNTGVVTLENLSTNLPGNSGLSVNGRLAAVDGLPAFEGYIAAKSDNLRSLVQWLGVTPSQLPSDRLRNFSYTSKLKATPKAATITDISIQLDASRINAGMALELREKPGVGLRLAIDNLNLDAYLSKPRTSEPSAANSSKASDLKKNQEKVTSAQEPKPAAAAIATLDRLFNAVDANIELTAAHLIFAGERVRNAKANLTIFDRTITVHEVSVSDFAGLGASFAGNLSTKSGKPTLSLDYAIALRDAARLARFAGATLPMTATQLGKVSTNGHLEGTINDLQANLWLKALGASTKIKGTLSRLLNGPSVNLHVSLKHPELSIFARKFAPSYRPAVRKLGPLDASATLQGNLESLQTDLRLKALGASTRVKGPISRLSSEPSANLRVSLKHPEVSSFVRKFVPSYRPAARKLGLLDASATLRGDAKAFAIEKLDLKAGPVAATGTFKGTLAGKRHKFDLDLKTNEVLLDLFLPAPASKTLTRTRSSQRGDRASLRSQTQSLPTQRWSTDPITIPIPIEIDAVARIGMAAFTKGNISLKTPTLRAALGNGRFVVEDFQARLFGGNVSGKATLQPSGNKATIQAELSIEKLNSRLALKSLTGHDRLQGPLTVKADIATQGNSEASLVSNLNGNATVSGQAQVLLTKSERNQIGVVTVGSNLLASLLGSKVRELQSLSPFTQLLASLDQAFGRNSARLSGDIRITRGIIQTNNLALHSQGNIATTRARVDLPSWQLSSTTELVDDPRQEPLITFSAAGPIDAPSRNRVGGRLLKQGKASVGEKSNDLLQQAIPGLLGGSSQSDKRKKVNPGKLLKGIFKQLQR